MNIKEIARLFAFAFVLPAVFFSSNLPANAQGTSFTYQGRLMASGAPANGKYDLEFTMYDAASDGLSVGNTLTNLDTGVTNGLFTLNLDFGAGMFTGPELWLGIGVRTNGSHSAFTQLSPRQPITPIPYAITAENLNGTVAASQISGTVSTANLPSVQTANVSVATNLYYSNYSNIGVCAFNVNIGDSYVYVPTAVNGIYDGTYELCVTGTNILDPNALFIDPASSGSLGNSTPSQVFTATQSQVFFVNLNATSGPVSDLLYDADNVTNVGTIIGTGQLSGSVTGNISGGTLAGDAQGGAVTNLDANIQNTRDYGNNITAAFQQLLNSGGEMYVPVGTNYITQSLVVGQSSGGGFDQDFDTPLTVRGLGTGVSHLRYAGSGGTMFDNTTIPHNVGLNLENIDIDNAPWTGVNNGYVGADAGSGGLFWQNVLVRNFNLGASITQSGSQLLGLETSGNSLGLRIPWLADDDIIFDSRSLGNSAAGLDLDSRGNLVFFSSAGDQIGMVIGDGGNNFVKADAENATNCVIAFGYPPSWPAGLPGYGNGAYVTGGMFGFGYVYPGPGNTDPTLAATYMKIWNAPASKVEIHSVSYDENQTPNAGPCVESFTSAADSFTPFTFDGVTTEGANLFAFSDGTFIPSEDGWHVGVNDPDLEFTKNVLEYSRDTNGNLYVAGNITNAGTLTTSAAQLGALTLTGAPAGSLLGTDGGNNVTGITIGQGLTLSGGTLSIALGYNPHVVTSSVAVAQSGVAVYSSSRTATAQDSTILVNGPAVTVTLPDAGASAAGKVYHIKLIANSTATVAAANSETIDGKSSYLLSSRYQHVTVQSDGANWWVIEGN